MYESFIKLYMQMYESFHKFNARCTALQAVSATPRPSSQRERDWRRSPMGLRYSAEPKRGRVADADHALAGSHEKMIDG